MIEKHLLKYFGFATFKKGQAEVIQTVLDGQSAAAIFPTGAGKSLCYQLPAMLLPDTTLVVSPLLSLMKDQIDFLLERGIPAARLDSTLTRDQYARILEQAKQGALKILMISVERFRNERFRMHLKNMKISLMVIDEAHCISEWGHNFRPDYLKLPEYKKIFNIPQVLLLTATATPQVIDDMCQKFDISKKNVTVTGFYRDNLFLKVTPTPEAEKAPSLVKRLKENPHAPNIVYVTLQKTAEQVAEFLKTGGIDATAYHAGMASEAREEIQNRFMEGKIPCIVATIAFGMGIDKKNIRRIIHYDLPKSMESYSQEIGRAGRDDQASLCEILANRDHIHILENFVYGDTPEKQSLYHLLMQIKTNPELTWEIKFTELSNALDIRILPLKTALVYLELEDIIHPKWTYFDVYTLKHHEGPTEIINRFQGERRQFVAAIFQHCETKRVWTQINIPGILRAYATDRRRIIAALEYFDEQGWIELQARQAIDVYEIKTQAFTPELVSEKLYRLFKKKESYEIRRIHQMVAFFESDDCLSHTLARYFGEHVANPACGHCSYCHGGKAVLNFASALRPLSDFDAAALSRDFRQAMGDQFTIHSLTKFLCGIHSPAFTKRKIKSLPHFGILDRYPFQDVHEWAQFNATVSRQQTAQ